MQIFQTIWTALTTENELLSNILYLPIMFLESTINTLIFTTLLNIEVTRKQKIRYILFISVLLYISGLLIPNPYKFFVNVIIIPLSIHFLLNVPILKSFLCLIVSTIFSFLSESIILKLSMLYFKLDISQLTSVPVYRLIIAIFIQLFVFIMYLFIKYSKDKEKLYNLVKNDIRFHRIDKKAGRVINAVTGARINMDESGETIDMCKAIQDLQDEAMQAGIKKGIQTGIQTGIKTGKEAGKQEEKEGLILRMLKKKKYTYEEIAELAEVSVEKVKEIEVKMK